MSWSEAHDELFKKVNREMDEYALLVQSMTPNEVYNRAEEISAMRFCYNQLVGNFHDYPAEHMEYLLRFEQPLAVVRDRWLSEQSDAPSEAFGHTLWGLWDKQDAEVEYTVGSGPSMS